MATWSSEYHHNFENEARSVLEVVYINPQRSARLQGHPHKQLGLDDSQVFMSYVTISSSHITIFSCSHIKFKLTHT